jgi:hypothetical protein
LNAAPESFIEAIGGNVVQTIQDSANRNYTVHRFTTAGTFTFTILDEGTFDQTIKFTVQNGSYDGATVQGEVTAGVGSYTVVVNSGGRVDVAYPQDGGTNDIAFSTINPVPTAATGGSISAITVGGREYRLHTFSATGTSTFNVTTVGNFEDGDEIEYLVVAGGGGGAGYRHGGGGGAGGMLTGTTTISTQSYSVTVGAGGSGGPTVNPFRGTPGGNSSFGNITAIGGGEGGTAAIAVAGSGGSGGGSSRTTTVATGTAGQGNNGGIDAAGLNGQAAGGGGAGQVGGNTVEGQPGGKGGDGLPSSITGTQVYYAGGGGGGGAPYRTGGSPGLGGLGGGGNGNNDATPGQNGQPNTGGGGGGQGGNVSGAVDGAPGGSGGSGVVIIRYPLEPATGGI